MVGIRVFCFPGYLSRRPAGSMEKKLLLSLRSLRLERSPARRDASSGGEMILSLLLSCNEQHQP